MDILKKYMTKGVTWNGITALADMLLCNQWNGIAPPPELAYLSHEYNLTTTILYFDYLYLSYGSELLTSIGSTEMFRQWTQNIKAWTSSSINT